MSEKSARDEILGRIRRSLKRGPLPAATAASLSAALSARKRGIGLARVKRDQAGLAELFVEMAKAVATTVARVPDLADAPAALARYLAAENLPARVVASPALEILPWASHPPLDVRFGAARETDSVSVTPVFAAIAETGTLMTTSGPKTPATLNFLPETHVAILQAGQIVGAYEDAWDRFRDLSRDGLPRTVNLITGPSRTGDIEQTIMLGAHGPRRLHVILVG